MPDISFHWVSALLLGSAPLSFLTSCVTSMAHTLSEPHFHFLYKGDSDSLVGLSQGLSEAAWPWVQGDNDSFRLRKRIMGFFSCDPPSGCHGGRFGGASRRWEPSLGGEEGVSEGSSAEGAE